MFYFYNINFKGFNKVFFLNDDFCFVNNFVVGQFIGSKIFKFDKGIKIFKFKIFIMVFLLVIVGFIEIQFLSYVLIR